MSTTPLASEKPLLTFGVLTDVQYADCDDKPAGYDPSLIRYYRNALSQVERAYSHWSRPVPGSEERAVRLVLQLGDLIDINNGGCGVGLDRVLSMLEALPTYHTLGNHELYNCTRRELVARYVCPHLLPDWTPPSSDDPVFYYSFSPVPGVKLISLDCFEESVLGRDPSELRWQQAAQLLTRVHGTTDPEVWEWPDNLQGLDKRFIDSNGALSEAQLHWLGAELTKADAAGDIVIVFGHLAVHPSSANSDCLLWNYRDVMDLFEAHRSVALYLCGHTHRCGYATDAGGTHYMALAGIIETDPQSVAFSTVTVFPDRVEVVGSGREESRVLRLCSAAAVEGEEDEAVAASTPAAAPLAVRVAV